MVTFTEACPLDYHKTWDQLKRKCHKESLWAVSVRSDIYIERAVVALVFTETETHHQERKERLGWPELPAGARPACGPWPRH